MRRVRLTPSRSTALEAINVTPLIDVVMCLIIFFLIVGKLAHEQGARVNLPSTGLGTTDNDQKAVIITVAPVNASEKPASPDTRFELSTTNPAEASTNQPRVRITVDGEIVTTPQQLSSLLNRRLQQQPTNTTSSPTSQPAAQLPVQIRVDRDLPYSAVAPALSACKELGLTSVRLITERTSP